MWLEASLEVVYYLRRIGLRAVVIWAGECGRQVLCLHFHRLQLRLRQAKQKPVVRRQSFASQTPSH